MPNSAVFIVLTLLTSSQALLPENSQALPSHSPPILPHPQIMKCWLALLAALGVSLARVVSPGKSMGLGLCCNLTTPQWRQPPSSHPEMKSLPGGKPRLLVCGFYIPFPLQQLFSNPGQEWPWVHTLVWTNLVDAPGIPGIPNGTLLPQSVTPPSSLSL